MISSNTPVWQLSVAELIELIDNQLNKTNDNDQKKTEKQYLYGIAGISKLFNCSLATANRIKRSGVIDKAIRQVGKKIIIDAELAMQLINEGRRKR